MYFHKKICEIDRDPKIFITFVGHLLTIDTS